MRKTIFCVRVNQLLARKVVLLSLRLCVVWRDFRFVITKMFQQRIDMNEALPHVG